VIGEGIDDPNKVPSWVTALGIVDHESGSTVAASHRKMMLDAGGSVLKSMVDVTQAGMVFCGFMSRAQGLHEGAVAAIEARNPVASFSLIRAHSENMAAILYAADHPRDILVFLGSGSQPYVKPGRITNYIQKAIPQYKHLYEQLSEYVHAGSLSIISSFQLNGDRSFNWSSSPRFRNDREILLAYGWVCEISDNTAQLLTVFADRYGLRDSPNHWDAEHDTRPDVSP
jgi:hypothetical protein